MICATARTTRRPSSRPTGGSSDWRKPGPGMLLDLLARWQLDPASCILVGDQPSDLQAAQAANVPAHLFPGGDLLTFIEPLLDVSQSM